MTKELYRYTFKPDVPLEEIEGSLLLAILATESLHGEAQVRLDAAHFLDSEERVCVIDAGTAVGRDLNRLFAGFFSREFGEDAFEVQRVNQPFPPTPSRGTDMILGMLWPSRNGHALIEDLGFLVQESEEEYRSKSQKHLDGEQLGEFRENAFLFRKRQQGLVPRPEPFDGAVDRAAVLRILRGREHYEATFAIGGPINPRTGTPFSQYSTEYEQWGASHGKPVLSTEQAQAIKHIAFGVRAHDAARGLLAKGVALGIVRGDYCGVPRQARIDWFHPRQGIVALVPCDDLGNAAWTIRCKGPAHGLAFRQGLIAAVTGHDVPAHVVAVEKRQPHRCGVWVVSRRLLRQMRRENEKALRQLAKCRRLDRWPTGYETVRTLTPSTF